MNAQAVGSRDNYLLRSDEFGGRKLGGKAFRSEVADFTAAREHRRTRRALGVGIKQGNCGAVVQHHWRPFDSFAARQSRRLVGRDRLGPQMAAVDVVLIRGEN